MRIRLQWPGRFCPEALTIQLIAPDWCGGFADELHEMHRLRYRVFKERLDWDVQTNCGYESDDVLKPHYLIWRGSEGLDGCVRLLPSNGPTMLRDTFPVLLERKTAPEEPSVWENSRFALDLPPSVPRAPVPLLSALTSF